ncbi:MAG: hypothetical protein JWM86_777 [Thermoleophilia bacterium]|nr:hypothetical protein [Thermoleophilia bacterium]
MDDERLDRPRTGDAAGSTTPAPPMDPESDGGSDNVPARDWSRRKRAHHEAPLTVSWVDDKGSVVRLITASPDRSTNVRGA